MALLTQEKITQRLQGLDEKPESIQTCSAWILHHSKPQNLDIIFDTWLRVRYILVFFLFFFSQVVIFQEVYREKTSKRLINLVWVANDVSQNSRKKGSEVTTAFFPRIESAFKHIRKNPQDDGVDKCVSRCVDVWDSRRIFSREQLHRFESALGLKRNSAGPSTSLLPESPEKMVKAPEFDSEKLTQLERATREMSEVLRRLEKAPSSDEKIRTQLAQFPESTGNASYLQHVRNEKEAQSILERTKEAGPLCKEYCDSLANEVLDRRNLQNHLNEVLDTVKLITNRNNTIMEDLKKREKIMKNHLDQVERAYDSLPDFSEMELDFQHTNLPSLKELFE
ncbi:hypothetical protein PENTCL1PPCAC_11222 [Pristionchus entomophagus]|uniref:CID domain-containing protein n=1 Tax=Pristionchus entomophagus TaxID=358040 RepID=A0AAV5T229_9BILA|nr:hypothetical protein PENTCL1PPCAC_11222 [Pristionchus entomophagus]